MHNSHDATRLAEALASVATEVHHALPETLAAFRVYERGYRSSASSASIGNGASGGSGSPTERLALAGVDAVDRDRANLGRSLAFALQSLHVALNIVMRYRAPVLGATEDQDGDQLAFMWCQSCKRDNRHLSSVSGHHRGLCRWCGDFQAHYGCLPTVKLLRDRHEGKRITERVIARELRRAGLLGLSGEAHERAI